MGLLQDYLKILPDGLKHWKEIAESIKNELRSKLGNLSEEEVEEITKRRLICEQCPFHSDNAQKDPAINYQTQRLDKHCIMCGCNIHLKTECLDCNCGIEVYNSNTPQNQLELKWKKFEK